MSGRRSAACDRALKLYREGGRTIAAAATQAGVATRTLRRALRAEGTPPGVPGRLKKN